MRFIKFLHYFYKIPNLNFQVLNLIFLKIIHRNRHWINHYIIINIFQIFKPHSFSICVKIYQSFNSWEISNVVKVPLLRFAFRVPILMKIFILFLFVRYSITHKFGIIAVIKLSGIRWIGSLFWINRDSPRVKKVVHKITAYLTQAIMPNSKVLI